MPAALALNLWNNDFPLGFHYDEPKKVGFLLDGDQDFHHPLLMLQIARAANALLQYRDPLDVAVLGRTTTAFAAVLLVLCSYWLAREAASPAIALFVAVGVALAPMTVMHAHYFKEDILFAAWAIASLASYIRLLREPTFAGAVLLGVTTGLAGASQYKAALLLPLYLLFPLVIAYDGRKRLYVLGGLAAFIAVDLFVLVNLPMVADVQGFLRGVEHDRRQLADPPLPISALDHWCTFYWTHGIVPGLTLPLALTGLAGLVGAIATWSRTPWEWKLLAGYVLLFYFVQEFSSSKPPPNHERYMAAVAPVLICFAGFLIQQVVARVQRPAVHRIAVTAAVGLVVYAGVVSMRLCAELSHDTRQRAEEWLSQHGGTAVWERFAGAEWTVECAAGLDIAKLRRTGERYVVTSSFGYEPYTRAADLGGQTALVYEIAQGYRDLFVHPCVEFPPRFRSFGFNNPVVRIVELETPAPPGGVETHSADRSSTSADSEGKLAVE